MDTSFSDRKYMSFQDYRIQNWVSRHSISPEMYSPKYSVCVCVCVCVCVFTTQRKLVRRRKGKKKILKKTYSFKLENQTFQK